MAAAFDVAIVGGGPAGAAAALELARGGCRVTLLEAGPAQRPGRCGELLSGKALFALDALGVASWLQRSRQIECHGVEASWGIPGLVFTSAICNPFGGGYFINRGAFEHMLLAKARRLGVHVQYNVRLHSVERARSGFTLGLRPTARGKRRARALPTSVEARYVVDASGQARALTRRLGVRAVRFDRQIALVAWLNAAPCTTPLPASLLLEACEAGWWYTAPVPSSAPGGSAVSAFVCDPLCAGATSPEQRWQAQLLALSHTPLRLAGYRIRRFEVVVAGTSKLERVSGPDWIALGDAALTFDPLSSRGLHEALSSGLQFARAFSAGGISAEDYQSQCDLEFETYRATLRWFHEREERWPHSAFWRTRHAAQPEPAASDLTPMHRGKIASEPAIET